MTYLPYMSPPAMKPRATPGLLAFGIVSIVLGGIAGLFALIMPLSVAMVSLVPARPGVNQPKIQIGTVVVAFVFYAAASAAFIATGMGTCRARRWVRPVVLSVAWPVLALGLFTVPMMVSLVLSTASPSPGAPPQLMMAIKVMMLLISGTIYIAIPLAFILFFQRASVKATLAMCDPLPRWTDRCPIPVLSLSLWLCITSVSIVMMMQFMCVPAFGYYVTGWPAVGILVIVMAALLWSALQVYRLRPAGWWTAMALLVVWFGSAMVTFGRNGLMDFYRHSNIQPEQLALLENQPILQGSRLLGLMIMMCVLLAVYLVYVRRFFKGGGITEALVSPIQPEN